MSIKKQVKNTKGTKFNMKTFFLDNRGHQEVEVEGFGYNVK
jgi:hypothetical protein